MTKRYWLSRDKIPRWDRYIWKVAPRLDANGRWQAEIGTILPGDCVTALLDDKKFALPDIEPGTCVPVDITLGEPIPVELEQ